MFMAVSRRDRLNDVVAVDRLADLQHFGIRQLADAPLGRDADLLADFRRELRADPVDILKRDQNALLGRNIHTCDTSHFSLSWSLRPALEAGTVPYPYVFDLAHQNATRSARATFPARPNPKNRRYERGVVARTRAAVNTGPVILQYPLRPRQDLIDLTRDLRNGGHPVNRLQLALGEIVADERRRLAVIGHETGAERIGVIVGAHGAAGCVIVSRARF